MMGACMRRPLLSVLAEPIVHAGSCWSTRTFWQRRLWRAWAQTAARTSSSLSPFSLTERTPAPRSAFHDKARTLIWQSACWAGGVSTAALTAAATERRYVAGGVACLDLDSMAWKWVAQLDLTTDETRHRAHVYSPPVVADLEGDGAVEVCVAVLLFAARMMPSYFAPMAVQVIVGTSLGFLYVLDATGATKPGFPVQVIWRAASRGGQAPTHTRCCCALLRATGGRHSGPRGGGGLGG